jgi:hypothetical protein
MLGWKWRSLQSCITIMSFKVKIQYTITSLLVQSFWFFICFLLFISASRSLYYPLCWIRKKTMGEACSAMWSETIFPPCSKAVHNGTELSSMLSLCSFYYLTSVSGSRWPHVNLACQLWFWSFISFPSAATYIFSKISL